MRNSTIARKRTVSENIDNKIIDELRDDYGRTNFNNIKFSAALEKKTGLKMLTVG